MPAQQSALALPALVPEQIHLTGYIPTVIGPVEYREWYQQLERINGILDQSGVETTFQRLSLARRNEEERLQAEEKKRPFRELTKGEQAEYQRLSSQALRSNVARTLTGESLRDFGCRLSESMLLQWFCRLDRIDTVRIPGKSALQRYSQWLPEAEMRQVIDTLLGAASAKDAIGGQTLELKEALDLEAYFLDTTCVKLHMHFPVDWVLLRDAARTLLKAIMLIRKRGLKVRMEAPAEFLKQMNRLCIKMTHARRKKDAKRVRKSVLREMKKLERIIAAHAVRHRVLLEQRWAETDLTQGAAQQIMGRIDKVLEQLPQAVRQAHERIIGERQVPNKEKLLSPQAPIRPPLTEETLRAGRKGAEFLESIYENDVAVYVRGKAGAEVEFGRQLLLGESESGVIVDWELVCGLVQADTKMLSRSLERVKQSAGSASPKRVCGDRGFDSKANRVLLQENGIYNAICPKAPGELEQRMGEAEFVKLQQRRSQTEARISIFKHGFLGSPLMSKGSENQKREVAWSVLTHNLWVIARLPRSKAVALAKAS